MVNTTILLHANILYAEIPFKNIPQIVENSYIPVLKGILKYPEIKIVLNFSGFTLEVLNGEHPDIYKGNPEAISLIKKAIKNKQIELTGTSWSHAVLPIMPLDLIKLDIELYNQTIKRILNYEPKGFFPPELGISPLLPEILKNMGYEWCFFDKDFIDFTKKGHLNTFNDFEPSAPLSFTKQTAKAKFSGLLTQVNHLNYMKKLLKEQKNYLPIKWQGTNNSFITGIGCGSTWMTYSLTCLSRIAIMNENKLFKAIKTITKDYEGLFMPYSSDIEFYGYGGNTVKEPVPVSRLEGLFKVLCMEKHLNLILPSDYLLTCEPNSIKDLYLKSGSWSSDKDFSLWEKEEDNRILNKLSQDAYYSFCNAHKDYKRIISKKKDTSLLKNLLLAYNSDGRGWTPLPEHRLFCLNKALAVKSSIEK